MGPSEAHARDVVAFGGQTLEVGRDLGLENLAQGSPGQNDRNFLLAETACQMEAARKAQDFVVAFQKAQYVEAEVVEAGF